MLHGTENKSLFIFNKTFIHTGGCTGMGGVATSRTNQMPLKFFLQTIKAADVNFSKIVIYQLLLNYN